MVINNSTPLFCWTVLYPNKESSSFDFIEYSEILIPEYVEILGENCVKYEVRKGLAAPGAPSPNFVCILNIWISSREKFRESLADPGMKELMQRISAITDIQSVRQMEEVIVSK